MTSIVLNESTPYDNFYCGITQRILSTSPDMNDPGLGTTEEYKVISIPCFCTLFKHENRSCYSDDGWAYFEVTTSRRVLKEMCDYAPQLSIYSH
jgi:hypothetical protein